LSTSIPAACSFSYFDAHFAVIWVATKTPGLIQLSFRHSRRIIPERVGQRIFSFVADGDDLLFLFGIVHIKKDDSAFPLDCPGITSPVSSMCLPYAMSFVASISETV
jgi:hypothetical protein